jgi:hypothetical protein
MKLTLNEYCIADTIYHLSNNPSSQAPGWCYKSKESMAEDLGLTKQSVLKIIDKLIKSGLVEKADQTKFLRTTDAWYETVVVGGKESLPSVKKVYDGGKESLPQGGKESLPNIYIRDINNNNNKTKASEKDFALTRKLQEAVIRRYPFTASKITPQLTAKEAEVMQRINRIDGYPYDLIELVIDWSQQDEFWQQNIRSVFKLRKQFDTLLIRAKAENDIKKRKVAVI